MKKIIILTLTLLITTITLKAQVEIVSTGSATSYNVNIPGVFPLRNGLQVTFKAHVSCNAGATVNVTGTGAILMRKLGGTTNLDAGDILAGQVVILAYDGTNWQMISALGSAPAAPTNYWSPNGTDIYNNNIGEVGIGTTTPASKLDVVGDVNSSDVYKLDGTTFLSNLNGNVLVGNTVSSVTGLYNVFVGEGAGQNTTTSWRNTFMGRSAGNSNVTGEDNTALGAQAAFQANASYNTSIGAYANSGVTSGANNTSLGYSAGSTNTIGSNNTMIGYNANVGINNLTNATAIGYNAVVNQSNSLVLGSNANVGIGASSPAKVAGSNRYLTIAGTEIGTTNASASVELVGNAGAVNTMASKVDFIGVTPISNAIFTRARIEARTGNGATGHGQLVFSTFNGTLNEAMRIRESGHIGIGGSGVVGSPLSVGTSNQFQIDTNGNVIRIRNVSYSWPNANGAGFLSNDGSGNLSWSSAGVLAGGTTNYVPKWTSANALSSTSLIYDNGNVVGIGTAATPSTSRLHVHSTSGSGNFRLTGASTGMSSLDGFSMSNDGSNVMYMTQHENDDWYFNTNGGTLGIAIKPTGNVGIGTMAVNNKLDVEGAAVIGASYSGTNTAPTNGLLVEGNVAIGSNSPLTNNLYVLRPNSVYGPGYSAIYGYRQGTSTATNGGTSWGVGGVDAAVKGYSDYGNNYTAGVAGYMYLDFNNSAGVFGSNQAGTIYGALAIKDNAGISWAGYFAGGDMYLQNRLRIGSSASAPTEAIQVSSIDSDIDLETYSTAESSSLHIKRARGSVASPSLPVSGDYYGGVAFQAWNGSSFQEGARVQGVLDGTPSGTSMPGRIEFWTTPVGSNTAIERMEINNDGNVGIGVSVTGSFKLDVRTSTEDRVTYFFNNKNSTSTTFGVYAGAHGTGSGEKRGGSFEAVGGTGVNIGVRGMASGGSTNWAGYFDVGNVFINDNLGIGVSPGYKLHVQLASTGTLAYFDNNTTAGGTALNANLNATATVSGTRYGLNTTAWYGLGISYGVYAYAYGNSASTTNYGVYAVAGGVGGSTNWAVYSSGNQYSTTGTAWTTSDEKFKSNIEDFSGALALINKLDIKTYYYDTRTYKDMNLPKEKQFGFLAQDLEKVFPEMVMDTKLVNDDMRISNPDNDPNYEPKMIDAKVIKTDGLLPIAIQAIKEQQLIIEQLKARIEALEKK